MMRLTIALAIAASTAAVAGCGRESRSAVVDDAAPVANAAQSTPAAMPEMNARRGRLLFVSKGCVICHAVNGVGGKAAPDLSAQIAPAGVNPLDFSARMWRGAAAMTALQQIELGYVINLDARDIADLAAFSANPAEQALLTPDSVSEDMRSWFLDAPHWRSDEWEEFRGRGEQIPFDDGEER